MIYAAGIVSYSQTAVTDKIPVTANSNEALESYNQAMKYFDYVNFQKGFDFLEQSLNEDPDFFMANLRLALYNMSDTDMFNEHAAAAINCEEKLSEAEELLKGALMQLTDNQQIDVTDVGRQLVEMYPGDDNAYYFLSFFQSLIKDANGSLGTLSKLLTKTNNPAPVHNMLGYVYMQLNQGDKAEAAFDKYIELQPENPNVYDSKGDYYMFVKNYNKAYDSFMKAYNIDTTFSYKKAMEAKRLSETIKD